MRGAQLVEYSGGAAERKLTVELTQGESFELHLKDCPARPGYRSRWVIQFADEREHERLQLAIVGGDVSKSTSQYIRGKWAQPTLVLRWSWQDGLAAGAEAPRCSVQAFLMPNEGAQKPAEIATVLLEFRLQTSFAAGMTLQPVDESQQTAFDRDSELAAAGARNRVVNFGFLIPVLFVLGLFMPLDSFSAEAGRIWMGFLLGLFAMWMKYSMNRKEN